MTFPESSKFIPCFCVVQQIVCSALRTLSILIVKGYTCKVKIMSHFVSRYEPMRVILCVAVKI